ncbi:lysine acetyltransferase [Chaetomidium leptoderma]|uniref:Lysine acetyltransferase n=1 Tax=Chaetomidium leptoderma TaxID=669021 RepID=A0AAN6VPC2_9PEZI|nr:lysine acetyltransferase [Chaetomidium leptoderma]
MAQPMGLTASDMVFGEATSEQRQLAWELCGRSWAAPMSLDDYVEREQHLAEHDVNRDGRCRYWVLYLKGYPRQVIASCETTRKPVLVSDGNGQPAREGHGYAVTNVYTNPPYRRQGMAAFLLRRVQERMDADSDCSVMYSDSGRNYYASLGWSPFASRQATITLLPSYPSPPLGPQPQSPTLTTPSKPPQTRPLQLSDLPDLCKMDELDLTKSFDSLPADTKTHVAFLPTHPQISWHLARAEFDAGKIFPPNTTTTAATANPQRTLTKGAITLPTDGSKSWTYWSHDWRNKRLRVLRIVVRPEASSTDTPTTTEQQRVGDVAALLEAAVAEARRWGLGRVVVWNPDDEVRAGCKSVGNASPHGVKVVFEERVAGGVPSLRWKGGKGVRGVVWEENFGYCWC